MITNGVIISEILQETLEGGRNAALDEDFVSPIKKDKPKILMQFVPSVAEVRPKLSRNQNRGVPIKDSQPVSFRNKQSGVTNLLSKTRLSEVSHNTIMIKSHGIISDRTTTGVSMLV